MDEILRQPVASPVAWSATDMANPATWTYQLASSQVAELESALAHARQTGRGGYDIRREDFPLPNLVESIKAWIAEIEDGRGFLVVKGMPIDRYDEASIYDLYWGLGTHFGYGIVQNYEGRRINEVSSRGHDYGAVNIRAYATSNELFFHNDPSDLAILFCVRQAKSGGHSHIASSSMIYNDILREHPEYLETLYRGFHHDVRGEGPTGKFDEVTDVAIPIYSYFAGKLSCCLSPKACVTGREKMGGTLTDLEREIFAFIESCAARPDRHLSFKLEPGDMLMMNNYTVFHGRSGFEDWPEPDRKRLLLRLWLNLHEGRALAPRFTGRFNTGDRGGAVVQNHTDEILVAAGR